MDKYEKKEGGTRAVRQVGGGRGGGRMEGGRESGGRQRKTTHTHRGRGWRETGREGGVSGKREREGKRFFSEHYTLPEREGNKTKTPHSTTKAKKNTKAPQRQKEPNCTENGQTRTRHLLTWTVKAHWQLLALWWQ